MDISALLVAAFGGQLLTETGAIPIREAQVWVKTEVQKDVTDAELLKKVPFRLLELKQAGKLNREHLSAIVHELIRQHYLAASCKSIPLPDAILNDRYGNVSMRDLLRVFNLYHTDEQGDGWSCGMRSDFSAAALHKVLTSGALVLSHEDIGRICREFREKVPGLKQSIEYIILRSKLDAVSALLRSGQKNIDEAIVLLRKDDPDCMHVLLQLQPDYFIVKVAKELLRENPSSVLDVIALLGKATTAEVKALSSELVQLLVHRLQQNSPRIAEVIVRILSAVKPLVEKDSDYCDLKRRVEVWGKNSAEHRVEILALALKGGHVGLRRQIDMLCKANGQIKILFEELETLLFAVDLQGLDLTGIAGCLDTFIKPSLQRVLTRLCDEDTRLASTCAILAKSTCPKFKSAVALFTTPEPVNDEIIALLRASKHPSISSVLASTDEAEHLKIQACIRALKALLYKYQRDNVDQIIAELRQVNDAQVKRAIELLGGKQGAEDAEDPELDKTLHEAKQLLEEVDRQKIICALKILEPSCVFDAMRPDAQAIKRLYEELELVKDPAIAQALILLKNAHTQNDALKAIPFIEKGDAASKKDVLALLRSDHTAGAHWRVQGDCLLAAESIRTIQASMPAEGELATSEHLISLAGMPALGLPRENVHILGDFLGRGLLFDFSDAILDSGISDAERTALEKCTSREHQSSLVEDAIKKHLKLNYLDKGSVNGAHFFLCNIKRPSEHWIVAAVVKFAYKKPILVILDSKNYPIQSENRAHKVGADSVLAFLFNKFIRPYN